MSFLSNILALLPDNISKRIKPVDLRTSFEYVYADMAKLQLDQVLTIGTITATTTTLNLALHASGVNSVLMSGVVRSKTEGDDFTFAPVSAGKLKYVLLYALPDPQLFHIIEGVEGNEAIYPDLPPGALLIKAVLISEFGALLEDADGGYKPLAEDPWRNIVINNNAAINVIVASSPSCSFNVLVGAGSTAPKIAGIRTKVKKNTRDGQEITFYNDSDTPVALLPGDYEETLVYTTFPFEEEYELKPRSFGKFKRKNNKYKELPAGGGKASEVENDSTVAGSNVKLALEHVQAEIDAEVVNRALADTNLQGQITTEKNRNDAQDVAIADKVDKPTSDGTWSLKKLGSVFTWVSGVVQNIANTDLSNISARIFTQGNTFTWNTAGFFHYLKGLVDKTGQVAYTKVVVVHPTTGEMVTRDFADPQAISLAVQNASTSQKTAMRSALLGTATPASPALQGVTSSFIEKDVETTIGIYGLNLTLLDPSFIYIELPDLTKIYATNFANINQYLVRVTWLIPNAVPIGNYAVKIQNGVAVQGLSKATINIINGGLVKYVFQANEWIIRRKSEASTAGVMKSNDYLRFPLENAGYRAKSNNVFNGSISAQWEFSVTIHKEFSGGNGSFADLTYFFGLTPTSNTDFSTYEGMMFNNALSLKTDGFGLFDNLNNLLISNVFLSGIFRIYVTKPTGSKAYFFIEHNNNFYFIQTFDLDPAVVYAMFLYKPNRDGSNSLGFECFFESKIVN